jgi:3-deoxy-D-manno-octulosonic-acid transferase
VRYLYSGLIHLLRPAAFAAVLWRGLGNRDYWQGLGERFGFGPPCASAGIMVHAVSLGEVAAAAPLVRALMVRHPDLPVVLTTSTPTGRARARALFGNSVDVRYLPYDTPGAMRRLLSQVRPRAVIVMETELWPNLFHACRCAQIPTILANARLSPRSVARYRSFGGLFRSVLADTRVAAQSAEDARRFIAIGASPAQTVVAGNLKFDLATDAEAAGKGAALRSAGWPARAVWVAGSTHAGEDEQVLRAHAELGRDLPGALLLLAPRHPQRFQSVADLLARLGVPFERRSGGATVRTETQVLLIDTVGELAALYGAADAAFVGGSLVPAGGHNLLEPAALGVPVVTGPSHSNGEEAAELLLREGAALQVDDATGLAHAIRRLLADPQLRRQMGETGRRAVQSNRGAVERLLDLVEPILSAGR